MNIHSPRDAILCEVGPRDGLQNTATFMPTAQKKAWIASELACGVTDIEICSFIAAKLIPQFIDAAEIAWRLTAILESRACPRISLPAFEGALVSS